MGDFRGMVSEMKPLIKKLKTREEQQRVVLWLKKLRESSNDSPAKWENRDMHAELLLHMLRRGLLEGPFNQSPEPGPLKTLPSYMSIYFDESAAAAAVAEPSAANNFLLDEDEFPTGGNFRQDGNRRRRRNGREFGIRPSRQSSVSSVTRTISPILSFDDEDERSSLEESSDNDDDDDVDIGLELDLEAELQKLKEEKLQSRRTRSCQLKRMNTRRRRMAYDGNWRNTSCTFIDCCDCLVCSLDEGKEDEDDEDDDDDVTKLLTIQSRPASRPRSVIHSPELKHRSWSRSRSRHSSPPLFTPSFTTKADAALQTFREERGMMRIQQKECDLKVKMEEARLREERMQMQAHHEQQIKEILDGKNHEIESLRSTMREKLEEAELTQASFQRKIGQLERETCLLREHKDKRQREMKMQFQEKVQDLKSEFDEQLEEVNAEFEGHKLALKQEHTRQMQELLEETSSRLKKMEGEYNAQANSKDGVIQELEAKCQQLKRDIEDALITSNRIAREKIELEMARDSLQTQLDEARASINEKDQQRARLVEEHQVQWEDARSREQTLLGQTKREYSQNVKRYADQMSELDHEVKQLKLALKTQGQEKKASEQSFRVEHQRQMQRLEEKYQKKIKSTQAESERLESSNNHRRLKLEAHLREQEEQIVQMKDVHKLQAERAERALEEFKQQAEKNSSWLFADMKSQMETVGSDLARSKVAREKQAREAAHQLEEIKARHSRELAEMRSGHEQERERLVNLHQAELESKVKEKERERDAAVKRVQLVLAEQEAQMKIRTQRDAQRIAELEQEMRRLRTEVSHDQSHHRSEMAELEMRRQEEREDLVRAHETGLSKCKHELEQHHLQMQQEHSTEMEKVIQKTSSRLKQMEKDYRTKADRANEIMNELQSQLHQTKSENQRLLQKLHDTKSESGIERQKEVQALKEQHHFTLKGVEQELMNHKSHTRQLEKKVRQLQLESQEKTTKLKLQYEEQLNGLLPASVRNELEGTIASLKSQTLLLQQRNRLLQDELDSRSVHPRYSVPQQQKSPVHQ